MEKEKKRKYNNRIISVEQGSFTPLVMSVNGGMGRECSIFYSKIAEQIAEKRKESKSETVSWIRRKISFCLLRSAIMCVRGTRSSRQIDYKNLADDDVRLDKTNSIF